MKKYTVKSIEKFEGASSFENVDKALINEATWIDNYRPTCYGQIVFVDGDGFYVKLTCHEKNPLARYKNFYEPVYTDSCMEFFANFAPDKGDLFFNCEMNSLGTILMGVGINRHNRKKITDYTDVIPDTTPIRDGESWSVIFHLPLETIYAVYGNLDIRPGFKFTGNLYKCGDETEIEHYMMWNPITVEEPDFHRPDYFGNFEIV